MPTITKAYAITADAVAAETEANGGDIAAIDVSKVVQLDDLELRDLGPRDVRLKILAVSAEHNIDHAATADTINIADARGGKMYPGNSAVGEVTEVGSDVGRNSVRNPGQSGQSGCRVRSIVQCEKSLSIGSRNTAISGMSGL